MMGRSVAARLAGSSIRFADRSQMAMAARGLASALAAWLRHLAGQFHPPHLVLQVGRTRWFLQGRCPQNARFPLWLSWQARAWCLARWPGSV